jgi:hypothetical protein
VKTDHFVSLRFQQTDCLARADRDGNDDAFRSHAQTVLDEVAHGDLAFTLEIWWPRFEAHDVGLL